MAAAERLGYRSNWAASALATRRSRLIGVSVGPVPEAMSILKGAEGALGGSGFACLLAVPPEPAHDSATSEAMLARQVEAMIYLGTAPSGETVDALAAQAVPWIAVTDEEGNDPRRIPCGRSAGGELAARYLLELGHDRFAALGRSPDWTRGVNRALARSEATLTHAAVTGQDPNAVKLAILQLLDRPVCPTAILCGSDAEALIAVRECALLGVPIPEKISIVGFGDEAFAAHTVPALTTVRGSPKEVGRRAAGAVLALLEGRMCESFKPPVKLVIRESAGPPP